MKFSIRTLLALMLVVALGFVAFRTHHGAIASQSRNIEIELAIERLQQELAVQPGYIEIQRASEDLRLSLSENRDRCEQASRALVQRDSAIEPRGPDVVSVRRYPNLGTEAQALSFSFRVLVPVDRPVWLKLGLHPQGTRVPTDQFEGSEELLLDAVTLPQTGPYEMRLPLGDHLVVLRMVDQNDRLGRIQFCLNDKVLAQPAMEGGGARTISQQVLTADQQIDIGPTQVLPRLGTFRLELSAPENSEATEAFQLSAWLSDRSSSFSPFPAQD